ncbi:MAG: hypothetical protein AB7Q04_13415 [Steroidobacteraceae bacterium]
MSDEPKVVNFNEYSMKANPKWVKAEDTDLMIAGSITACGMHLNLIAQYLNNTGRLTQSKAFHEVAKFIDNEAQNLIKRLT